MIPPRVMTVVAAAIGLAAVMVAARRPAAALAQSPPAPSAQVTTGECALCHSCPAPTSEDTCLLITCTHPGIGKAGGPLPGDLGPEIVILDELADEYLPVPFDHKGHAEMAEMGDGCSTCHHHTTGARPLPACKTCQAVSPVGADRYMPGLKGAYHQQCLNCHREWINEKDCDICHREKTSYADAGEKTVVPTADDILGLMHPPIPEPQGEFFTARSLQPAGSQVIFRHQEHTDRFGLRCVDCHHEPSCARCHRRPVEQGAFRTLAEHHRPCIRCHKGDMDLAARHSGRCERCHWRQDQPKPQPFDHGNTGWPLNRFHQDKGCRDCHVNVPFTKLDRECDGCHSDWSPATFDHRVTGQVLDEHHAEHDCQECHPDRRFDLPPACDQCHEEDEGITFPASRPGPAASHQQDEQSRNESVTWGAGRRE